MKQKLLNSLRLRVCALVALLLCATGSAWGQTETVLTLDCATPAPTGTTSTALSNASAVATFLNSAAGLSSQITCSSKTGDVYKGKGSGGGVIPQQCLKVGKASGGGGFTFTIPDTYDNIDVVELTCYGWKTTSSISINSGTAQTFTTAQSETTKTFELSSSTKTISIAVTTSAVCITEIVLKKKSSGGDTPTTYTVTYDANGGTGTMTDSYSPYEEGDEVTLLSNTFTAPSGKTWSSWAVTDGSDNTVPVSDGKFTMPASNVTVTAQWVAYTITAQSNNNSYGTVELNDFVITAAPASGYTYASPAYTVSSGNATVVQNDNDFTVTPTSNCTVTINFAAIPTHTATFSVNGVTTSQDFAEGATITFPSNPADISGKTFVGWVATPIDGITDEAPSFIVSATMGESDVTYYAVFADVVGDSESKSIEITSSTTGVPTSYGTANTFSECTFGDVKFQVMQMYNNNKLQWRASGNSNGTGTMYNSESLNKIESIVLTYNAGDSGRNFSLKIGDNQNPTDGQSITPTSNDSEYTFDCSSYNYDFFVLTNGSGAGYLDKLVINYTIGSATISGYCTTVAADTRKDAELAFSVSEANAEVGQDFTAPTLSTAKGFDGKVEYESSDENVAQLMDSETGELRIVGEGIATITATFAGNDDFKAGSASYTLTVTDNRIATTITQENITIDIADIATLTQLTPVVKDANDNVVAYTNSPTAEGLPEVYFEIVSDDNEIFGSFDSHGNVILNSVVGTATIKAVYNQFQLNANYRPSECTFTITVADLNAPGTENNPYTVADAIAATPASGTSADVYITGIVSAFYKTSIMDDGSYYRYYISDDGTTNNQLLVFRGKGLNNVAFSSADDLQLGDVVTIYGGLTTYSNAPEVAANNYIVSRVERPASDLSKTSDIALDFKNADLSTNVADHISSSSEGAYTYESADETIATVTDEGVVTGLKVGSTTITVNQAATPSYKAGTIEIPVTVADTRVDATTIPAINISSLTDDAEDGTISVVDPVKADEGVTFSFSSSNEDVLLIDGDQYTVGEIGTTTVTVTATTSNSDLYKDVTATFEVTVNAAEKQENVIEIAFDTNSTVYDTKLEGLVSGSTGFGGVITAESSNTSVLTVAVDSEGNVTVTPLAVGTATVTFSAAETAYFLPAVDVQQVFTVTAPEGRTTAPANGFTKVTATEDITDGEYLIVYEDVEGSVAFDGSLETLDGTDNTIEVEINDGVIAATNTTTAATFTIDTTAGTLQSMSGYYIGKTANSNGLDSNTETQYTNTFEIDGAGNAVITASGGCVLKYNSASNQNRFRYYKSGQQDIQLYRLSNASETVTLNKDGYATYCSVNPMDFSSSSTVGYTAWRVESISDEGIITYKKIKESIKGGQGVLLYNKDAEGESTNVTVNFADGTTEYSESENKLIGTTAPKFLEIGEVYGLSGSNFVINNADGVINAGKAYIKATDIPAEVKSFTFVFEDETTGITETRQATREEVESIFNLGGQRMSKVQRGINIVNGKKVLVK